MYVIDFILLKNRAFKCYLKGGVHNASFQTDTRGFDCMAVQICNCEGTAEVQRISAIYSHNLFILGYFVFVLKSGSLGLLLLLLFSI